MQLSLSFFVLATTVSLSAALPPAPTDAALRPVVSDAALPAVPSAIVEAIFGGNTTHALSKRSVFCQTSGGSPTTGDSIAAAEYIQSINDVSTCCQNNVGGSFCTTMWCTGTACVGICSSGISIDCDTCLDAGNGLLDIANSCSSNGLSGGWAQAPSGLSLILFHS